MTMPRAGTESRSPASDGHALDLAPTTGSAGEVESAAPSGRGLTLLVLLVATFMGQFDFFVVNVAAPSLRTDLDASEVALQLIVGGYAFTYAAGLITGGRLGDLYGHRRMYVIGMTGFAVASLLCGLADSAGQLVAARLLQGLTAAAMLPQVLGLITATVPASARPKAMAWYGLASGVGGAAGQVLGGLLLTADVAGLGWRLVFLVNVPIGITGAVLARRRLPQRCHSRGARLDPLGALGFTTGFALLLVPLTLGRSVDWAAWTWVCLLAAVPVCLAAIGWQRRLGDRGGSPMLDVRLLALATFRSGLAANLTFVCYFASFMFTLTLFLQVGLGLDALRAGLVFTPLAVSFSATALMGHRLAVRFGGPRVIVTGALISATATVLIALLAATGGANTSAWWVALIGTPTGIGNGLTLPLLIGSALVDVTPRNAGAASGALVTAQQFGGAAGVALVGTAYFALAGDGGRTGQLHAMAWSSLVEAALVLLVAVLVGVGARRRLR